MSQGGYEMENHQSVSSEQPATNGGPRDNGSGELHKPIHGVPDLLPQEATGDMVVQEFEGRPQFGELEAVAGFDPNRALQEGMLPEVITDELLSLTEHHPEGFPMESVCGNDDRIRISPATNVPWRWCCQLIITMANGGKSRCTGWFIGPRTVMTAGHCVYSRAAGGWARSIEVVPGMNAGSRPFGSQVGTSFRSVVGWTQNSDPNYDYGAIILPNNTLGNWVGYFGFASLSDSSLQNLLVNNAGYAGDKPFGTLWFNAGRVTNVTSRKVYYMIDTYGGHSGSPVWRYLNGQRHAIGIHAYGGCPNSATRIVLPVFNNMLAWRNLGFSQTAESVREAVIVTPQVAQIVA